MTQASKSIFVDLEIDVDLMVNDTEEFANQVYSAADSLASILNNKTSLKGAREEANNRARKNSVAKSTAAKVLEQPLQNLYSTCIDELSMDELFHAINAVNELKKDLELEFHSRANTEMIQNSPNATDKGLAHHQYQKLRTAFNAWREFAKLMEGKNYPPLDPKSGNYGDSNQQYPTYRIKGDVYNNYRAVARILGWNPDEFHSHQDLSDKLTETDNKEVEIIYVTL